MADDAMQTKEDVKVWEDGDPGEQKNPFWFPGKGQGNQARDGHVFKKRRHG